MVDYEKLRQDLLTCKQVAQQASENVEDLGSCNHDRPVLCDMKLTPKLEDTFRSADISYYKSVFGIHLGILFKGQAAKNTVGSEIFAEEMKARGYAMLVFYATD